MANSLKELILEAETKNPYQIVSESGVGFPPHLIPGHIFSLSINLPFQVNETMLPLNRFVYEQENNEKSFFAKEPYYDTMPIGICLRIKNSETISMLNLKVISPDYRYKILEMYYQMMKGAIHTGYEDDLSAETMTIKERMKENNYIAPFMAVSSKFMKTLVGLDKSIDFAINKYNISTIKNVRLLDWHTLPEIARMNISDNGLIINGGAGGIEGMFRTFESRMN